MGKVRNVSDIRGTKKASLIDVLKEIFNTFNEGEEYYHRIGIVKAVDMIEMTANVEIVNGATLEDVRLQQNPSKSGILYVPSVDSIVLLGWTDSTTAFISLYSELETIIFQDGTNDGLIKINELTTKLNGLVTSVNAMWTELKSHTHTSAAVGSPTTSPVPILTTVNAEQFNKSDYENQNFKH